MTSKQRCLENNQELFRKIQKQVERAKDLFAVVNLGADTIELMIFKEDRSGIDLVTSFSGYTQHSHDDLAKMLDAQAHKLRDRWLPEFQKLAKSIADPADWGLDLSRLDHAILEVGPVASRDRYRLKWCFADLCSAARYISDHSNPDILEDEQPAERHPQIMVG